MLDLFVYIIPIIFTHLFGLADAFMTARKDYPFMNNLIWDWLQKRDKKYRDWYIGGNHIYPPGNPFMCDGWHFGKHLLTFCISGIALSVVLATLIVPSYWLLLYGFLYGIEGYSFTFYYSYVFRTDRNFKWYLNHALSWGWKTQK